MRELILKYPSKWPSALLNFLKQNQSIFHKWENDRNNINVIEFDIKYQELRRILDLYYLVGWHCTRLTDYEIINIKTYGMVTPSLDFLSKRIENLIDLGEITEKLGEIFKNSNRYQEKNNMHNIWFQFDEPNTLDEDANYRLLRRWGGEALYSEHENDKERKGILEKIGHPCVIFARIPVKFLSKDGSITEKVYKIFLNYANKRRTKQCKLEDSLIQNLPAQYIIHIYKYPDKDFLDITGCEKWKKHLY